MIGDEERVVTDKDGRCGVIETVAAPSEDGEHLSLVWLEDGRRALIPTDSLVERRNGGYFLPASLMDFLQEPTEGNGAEDGVADAAPLKAKEFQAEPPEGEETRVRIRKSARERGESADGPLWREEVQVERVPVGRVVEGPVAVRQVGDTVIVPLLEEVLVVERRLVLKEELHITKRRVEARESQQVKPYVEEGPVERHADPAGPVYPVTGPAFVDWEQ